MKRAFQSIESGSKVWHWKMEKQDLTFSSSLMSVKQQSQASEVETQEEVLNNLHVDHNLLLRPTLQAICWLIDMTLSLDPALQINMSARPTFNLQAIDSTIEVMQTQINELAEQRHQIELSMVSICITHMFLTLVRLTVQLGLQFHMGVILTHCLSTGFWSKETTTSSRVAEVFNVILVIPIKTIWTWMPNVLSFTCLDAFRIHEN